MKINTISQNVLFFVVAGLTVMISMANAQDRVFTYTYQSPVLGKGQRELEVWNTFRFGRSEYYRAIDSRIEFEVGLGGNLQTAFYLNIHNSSEKTTVSHLGLNGPNGLSMIESANLASETELSFSNEWIYKVFDPVADPLGFAIYGEYAISSRGFELEPRLILDKSFGSILIAFNTVGEFEFEKEIDESGMEETEREIGLEFDLASTVHVANGIYLGIELVNKNGFQNGSHAYSAFFAGPTFSYTQGEFWVNLTLVPQVGAFKGATQDGLVLDHLERIETRLLFSYAF